MTADLAGVVVHWRDEEGVARLVDSWPTTDPRFELVVVDNSGTLEALPEGVRVLRPGRNLGFAGGVNRGVAATEAPAVLVLNPDARPLGDALESLLAELERRPGASGIVPRLLDPDGTPQWRWQLRRLPGAGDLLLHPLFVGTTVEPEDEPAAGDAIEQPAAAALLLRREVLEEIGGLDEGFRPAWFEDVDLARRLADRGHRLVYHPGARFEHGRGASVAPLGYGPFLWAYHRNLVRYLSLHHGSLAASAARALVVVGALGRLAALPLRRPTREPDAGRAARGLLGAAWGAITGWRRPGAWRRRLDGEG